MGKAPLLSILHFWNFISNQLELDDWKQINYIYQQSKLLKCPKLPNSDKFTVYIVPVGGVKKSALDTRIIFSLSFRLLKDAQNEAYFQNWYQKLLAALQFCAGKALSDEFSKEKELIKILEDIGAKVKCASDPQRQVC